MTWADDLEPGTWARGSLMTFSNAEAEFITSLLHRFPDLPAGRPFAANAFGNFWMILSDESVAFVLSEIFELSSEEQGTSFVSTDEWRAAVMADPDRLLGTDVAEEWARRNGPIPEGRRLAGKIPFVLGGGFDLSNLYCADFDEMMRFRAYLADQIRDLPDGATILLDITD